MDPITQLCGKRPANASTIPRPIVLDYANLVQWRNPTVLPNTLTFQVEVVVPLQLSLLYPSWGIIAGGAGRVGLAETYLPGDMCSTQTTPMSITAPRAVTNYPYAEPRLVSYVMEWVRTQENMRFESATIDGYTAQLLRGNMTIGDTRQPFVAKVTLGADNKLVYLLRQDIPWLMENCRKFGMVSGQSADGSIAYHTLLFSYIDRSYTDTWTSSAAYYSIAVHMNGAVVVSTAMEFQPSVVMKEAVAINSACPIGMQVLSTTFDLSYHRVYDQSIFVGPRTASDIKMDPNTCYHDTVTSMQNLGCSSNTCVTRIAIMSQCMHVPISGMAFLNCENAPSAQRLVDMGADVPYPTAWNAVHSFSIDAYACPKERMSDSMCAALHTPPDVLDSMQLTIRLRTYPNIFLTAPPFVIDFGMLLSADENLDTTQPANRFNSFTGLFNESNVSPYGLGNQQLKLLPSITPFDVVYVIVRLQSSELRSVYGLTLDLANLTITPTDSFGRVRSDLPVRRWKDIQSFVLYAPSEFRVTTCPSCLALPACQNAAACDGFGIWSGALADLWPDAGGFFFGVHYYFSKVSTTSPVSSNGNNNSPMAVMHGLSSSPSTSSGSSNGYVTHSALIHVMSEGQTTAHTIQHGKNTAVIDDVHIVIAKDNNLRVQSHFVTTNTESNVGMTDDDNIGTSSTGTDTSPVASQFAVFIRRDWLTGAKQPTQCQGTFRCWSTLAQAAVFVIPLLSVFFLIAICQVWRHRKQLHVISAMMHHNKAAQAAVVSTLKEQPLPASVSLNKNGPQPVVSASGVGHAQSVSKSIALAQMVQGRDMTDTAGVQLSVMSVPVQASALNGGPRVSINTSSPAGLTVSPPLNSPRSSIFHLNNSPSSNINHMRPPPVQTTTHSSAHHTPVQSPKNGLSSLPPRHTSLPSTPIHSQQQVGLSISPSSRAYVTFTPTLQPQPPPQSSTRSLHPPSTHVRSSSSYL